MVSPHLTTHTQPLFPSGPEDTSLSSDDENDDDNEDDNESGIVLVHLGEDATDAPRITARIDDKYEADVEDN